MLNIDADERVTPDLRASIERVVRQEDSGVVGYLMSRRTLFMGRWIRHGGHYPAWHLRLFLSRVHPQKGLPMLIKAWATVQPENWELVIAGPDEDGHRIELAAMIRQAGLEEDVRFVGPVSDADKWPLYRSADLLVLPTHSENFGLVIAEALAAEVSVITTKGGPWEHLETYGCGGWADVNVEALATSLGQAIALSDEQRYTIGSEGAN